MMGRQAGDQSQLFYLFNLEERIPARHLSSAGPRIRNAINSSVNVSSLPSHWERPTVITLTSLS